jgi:hypothetical protein
MKNLTREELMSLTGKPKGTFIPNIAMNINTQVKTDDGLLMVTPYSFANFEGIDQIGWLEDEGIWFFVSKAHPNFNKLYGRGVWKCSLVYGGDGYATKDRYYHVHVFYVHPEVCLKEYKS